MPAKTKRKRRKRFLLIRHPTGEWCRRINGKPKYFGSDKKAALERYLKSAAALHAGRKHPVSVEAEGLTVKDLAGLPGRHGRGGVDPGRGAVRDKHRAGTLASSSRQR